MPNCLGNGQRVSVNGEKGGRRASFSLSFTAPWFRDTRTSVGIDFFVLSRRSFDNNYDEDRNGLGVRIGRRLRWPDRFWSVFLRGRIQDVGFSNFDEQYVINWEPGVTAGPDPRGPRERLSSATVTFIRDSRNRAQFATSGMRLSVSVEYAGDAVGGYWHYHKELVEFAKHIPLYKEVALIFRARWGWLSPTAGASRVPFSEKFYIGGTNGDGMVRGYEEGTAGVRIIDGEVADPNFSVDRPGDWEIPTSEPVNIQYDRSESFTIYHLELPLPIAPPAIYAIRFTDAGRGFDGSSGWRCSSGLWRSAGVGARMVVPGVGTIGFDIAYGFDDSRVGGWRPHFQIGRGF